MSDITIYHNPRCSKSRQTLALLTDRGIEPTIVRYLETPPSVIELRRILDKLGRTPRQLMRTKEAAYLDLGLANLEGEDQLLQAMVDHPVLIERPIVVVGARAALGRPPERVLELLPPESGTAS